MQRIAWIALSCVASGLFVAACSGDTKPTTTSSSGSSSGTGGEGGTGGASSSNGSSSSSSGAGGCTVVEQCAASGPCKSVACVNGACVEDLLPAGTEIKTAANTGDCKRQTCDASGNVVEMVDDTDKPVDYNSCTLDVCTNGVPTNPVDASKEGQGCGTGQSKCASGVCAGCNSNSNCPSGGTCDKTVCSPQKVCGFEIDVGRVVSNPDPTDCFEKACDATGEVVTVAAPNEMPPQDMNECDVEACGSNGVVHNPVPDGTTCGASTECDPHSCMGGTCTQGTRPGNETMVGAQTAHDCKVAVCDGSGGVVEINDDTDVPADPNPTDCTLEKCTNGTPGTMLAPAGTPCTQANGTAGTCSLTGVCS